jgi:predicted secreted protein
MAAQTEIVNSTNVFLEISTDGGTSWDPVAHAKTAKVSVSHSPRDVSTKSTGSWRKIAAGKKQWNMSLGGGFTYDGASDADSIDLFDLLSAGTGFKARLASENSGDILFTGDVLVGTWEVDSPEEETNVSYAIQLEGSGVLAKSTVA